MNLAIDTPRGREFVQQQKWIAQVLAEHYGYARVDSAFGTAPINTRFGSEHQLQELAHIKIRQMSTPQLERFGSLLITSDKISDGVRASAQQQVPFCVYAYLLDDQQIVRWVVAVNGIPSFPLDGIATITAATCNGGTAMRRNVFLPYDEGRLLPAELAII